MPKSKKKFIKHSKIDKKKKSDSKLDPKEALRKNYPRRNRRETKRLICDHSSESSKSEWETLPEENTKENIKNDQKKEENKGAIKNGKATGKKRGRKRKSEQKAKPAESSYESSSDPDNPGVSTALLYYNIVTTPRAPGKRKIKPKDYAVMTMGKDDDSDHGDWYDKMNGIFPNSDSRNDMSSSESEEESDSKDETIKIE